MDDQNEPLFSCQDEFCRTECSFHAELLRLWGGEPICEDCYDALDQACGDDDPLSFQQLPPFVPAYQQTIEQLQRQLADAVANEREACAKVAEDLLAPWDGAYNMACRHIAAAIRERTD